MGKIVEFCFGFEKILKALLVSFVVVFSRLSRFVLLWVPLLMEKGREGKGLPS